MSQPTRPPHTEPVVNAPLFELSAADAVSWLRGLPEESVDLLVTDPAYESLEKHRAVGTTTRLKHSKSSSNDWFRVFPERAVRRALHRSVPRAQTGHALLSVLRRGNDVRRQAESRTGGFQILEAAGVGQAHDRDGLSLPRAIRTDSLLREGQAPAQRPRHRRHHRRAADSRRLSSREAPRRSRRCSSNRARSPATLSPIHSWDPAVSASPRWSWAASSSALISFQEPYVIPRID